MSGYSDPRLTLRAHELDQDGRPRVACGAAPGTPCESRLGQFWRRLSTRRRLLELDAAQLQDIGLTLDQARAEAELPFWKL
ncbi:MAG: hypothetical protein ABWY06_15275 [Pseudomonas sp.]|uniref:hypothetical protein n=1 Tax=Pseudomonas sp. TaxID=306 RepID=UPI003391D3FE